MYIYILLIIFTLSYISYIIRTIRKTATIMTKKALILILMILILDSSLFYSQLSGSSLGKEANGYSIGLSYGLSNQLSDIPSITSWNTIASIGKTLYFDTDALFSFDLLGNLAYSKSKGLDTDAKYRPFENSVLNKTDYTIFYNNHKTNLFSLGLDGKLTLNKYREDQNFYASFLLGGNWAFYSVKMDLTDSDGKYYIDKFDKIKNDSKSDKKRQLKEFMDGKYETKAEDFNKIALKSKIMPSIGLEFGYDLTDYLSIFVSDKLYFSNTNNLDGETHIDDESDLLNLANIGVNFYFHKKEKVQPRKIDRTMTDPENGYRIPKEVEDHNFPEVKIITPAERPFNSASPEVMIKARITNVLSATDIYCKVNGRKVPFDFNTNYVQFVAVLEPGDNKIQIYAKNEFGQSRDVISIYHKGGRQELTEPEIKLISPSESTYKSEEEIYTIKAIVKFVNDKKDIKILANGQPFKSYRFDSNTNEFKIKVRLAEGQNNFEIVAENDEGKAINSFDIYYKMDIPTESKPSTSNRIPEITILNPTSSSTNLGETDLLDFKAMIKNINSKKDIKFTVNGRKNRYFDYDINTGILTDKISLFDDKTIIKITASNSYGTSSAETEINLGELSNDDGFKPKNDIEFINVSKPDSDCKIDITAKIDIAKRKRDLKLFLNQFEVKNFSFSNSSKLLKSTLYLDEGKNIIKITHTDSGKSNIYQINCGLTEETDEDNNNNNSDNDNKIIKIKPSITFDYPTNNKTIDKKDITCKATIEHVKEKKDIRVLLNGEHIYNFDFDTSYNELSVDMTLVEGRNTIEVKASNEIGETEANIEFIFEEPLAGPPSVLINSPRNRYTTDENTVVFRATIENVKSTEDIYVTFNGNDFTDFNYDKERGIIFTHLPLQLGENTLRVDAENRLGTDFDEVAFQYREKVLPAVKIKTPKRGIIMGVAFAPIKAIVQNVKSKINAVIYINGKVFKSLKITGDQLTSRVPLSQGENEIIVKVANDYGSATDTTMVIFNGQPQKPTITFVNPSKSGKTVTNNSYDFVAKLEGIKHSSNVELTLNSLKISDVLYYRKDQTVKVKLNLRKGWNYITLIAKNRTGETREKTKIFLK